MNQKDFFIVYFRIFELALFFNNLKFCVMNTGKILLGVLAGVAAGALLGILYAPDKGCETRKKIAKKSKDYADGMTEKLNDFMGEVTEKYDSLVKKVKEVTGKATENVGSSN